MSNVTIQGKLDTDRTKVQEIKVNSAGAALTTAVSASGTTELTYVTYSGSGYTYWCEAAPGSARSSAVWHVARKTDADGTIIHAGTGAFEHAATDLATVAALTYTLGV